jgi:hypothetical protein
MPHAFIQSKFIALVALTMLSSIGWMFLYNLPWPPQQLLWAFRPLTEQVLYNALIVVTLLSSFFEPGVAFIFLYPVMQSHTQELLSHLAALVAYVLVVSLEPALQWRCRVRSEPALPRANHGTCHVDVSAMTAVLLTTLIVWHLLHPINAMWWTRVFIWIHLYSLFHSTNRSEEQQPVRKDLMMYQTFAKNRDATK